MNPSLAYCCVVFEHDPEHAYITSETSIEKLQERCPLLTPFSPLLPSNVRSTSLPPLYLLSSSLQGSTLLSLSDSTHLVMIGDTNISPAMGTGIVHVAPRLSQHDHALAQEHLCGDTQVEYEEPRLPQSLRKGTLEILETPPSELRTRSGSPFHWVGTPYEHSNFSYHHIRWYVCPHTHTPRFL